MNTNLKQDRAGAVSRASTTRFQGGVSRRVGNVCSVTLEGRVINVDHIFGAAWAIRESIEETFGETAHDTRLETDRKAYEFKDDVFNILDKISASSR